MMAVVAYRLIPAANENPSVRPSALSSSMALVCLDSELQSSENRLTVHAFRICETGSHRRARRRGDRVVRTRLECQSSVESRMARPCQIPWRASSVLSGRRVDDGDMAALAQIERARCRNRGRLAYFGVLLDAAFLHHVDFAGLDRMGRRSERHSTTPRPRVLSESCGRGR